MPSPILPSPDHLSRLLKSPSRLLPRNSNPGAAPPLHHHQTLIRLHSYTLPTGLQSHPALGNLLVSLLATRPHGLPSIVLAHRIFDRLPRKHRSACDSLVIGYAEFGEFQKALSLYQTSAAAAAAEDEDEDEEEKKKLVHPAHASEYAFIAWIKSCVALKDLGAAFRLHADIVEYDLLHGDVFIGSALVDMYAKLGCLEIAKDVFAALRVRNVVSWTAMITAFSQHGCDDEALFCLDQMQEQGIPPSEVTYMCALKACANMKFQERGCEIHSDVTKKAYGSDAFLCSALVDFYAKTGFLMDAMEILRNSSLKDVVLWTSLISGSTEVGCGEQALDNFEQMQEESIPPNSTAFVAGLKACGLVRDLDKGTRLYSDVVSKGLEKELYVVNTVIDMYAKCGAVNTAQYVFDKVVIPDIVTWNVLMAGYVENGLAEKARQCYHHLKKIHMSPTLVTYVWSMKACGNLGDIKSVYELHAAITKIRFEDDPFIASTLIDVYMRCASITEARKVFDNAALQTGISINVLIAGYIEHGHEEESLRYVQQLMNELALLDSVTLLCCLKACQNGATSSKQQQIHALSVKLGFEKGNEISNALIDVYSKCSLLKEARSILMSMLFRDVFSWTALITGYIQAGQGEEALVCLQEMQSEGICLDEVTLVCGLTACSCIKTMEYGQKLYTIIVHKGLEQENLVANTLIDLYAKFGQFTEAEQVFDNLRDLDVVSWNALIVGYASCDCCYEEALMSLETMKKEGFSPNAITLVSCLIACSNMGSIDKGRAIHAMISEKGFSDTDAFVGCTLVDMYTKCGLLHDAQEVFDKLLNPSLVTWNALIRGFAQLGAYATAVQTYERMVEEEGIEGDEVTFVSLLNVCSNTGRIDEGLSYYKSLLIKHCSGNALLTPEHHACIVDVFSRAGCISMALAMLEDMPFHPSIVLWVTMLGSCKKWGDVELGKHAFEHATQLVNTDPSLYVCMFNIYADANAAI